MKRRGIKSGNYIEYNLCTAVCIICDAKLCRDLFAKNKVKKRKKNKNGSNYVSNPDRPDKGIQETLNPSVPLHDARSHV